MSFLYEIGSTTRKNFEKSKSLEILLRKTLKNQIHVERKETFDLNLVLKVKTYSFLST